MSVMKRSLVAVLLLTYLLVTDTEAGWVRKAVKKVKNEARRVKESVKKVGAFVNKHSTAINIGIGAIRLGMAVGGKRSAEFPCPPPGEREAGMSQQRAKEVLLELELACPGFGVDPQVGLSMDAVKDAFDENDGDRDGSLNDKELELFEDVLEAYRVCVKMEERRK